MLSRVIDVQAATAAGTAEYSVTWQAAFADVVRMSTARVETGSKIAASTAGEDSR